MRITPQIETDRRHLAAQRLVRGIIWAMVSLVVLAGQTLAFNDAPSGGGKWVLACASTATGSADIASGGPVSSSADCGYYRLISNDSLTPLPKTTPMPTRVGVSTIQFDPEQGVSLARAQRHWAANRSPDAQYGENHMTELPFMTTHQTNDRKIGDNKTGDTASDLWGAA